MENQQEKKKDDLRLFLWIIGIAFVFYLALFQDEISIGKSSKKSYDESINKNSAAFSLAVINDESKEPQLFTIDFFQTSLNSLNNSYPDRAQNDIADALVSGYNILVKNGVSITLLEFTVAFDSYSRKIDKHWVLSLEKSLAIFIKTAYRF